MQGPFVRVRIPSDDLFNEGRVTLSPQGRLLLDDLARALVPARGWRLRATGHTDAEPRHSAAHPSNWELGFAQAMLVVRALQDAGLEADVTVGSGAGEHPLGPDVAKNRRVELLLRPPQAALVEPGP
jgi:flagellar motor protein MotB